MPKPSMAAIREARRENRALLLANGWPKNPNNQRHFSLDGRRVMTAFVKGKGFWAHLAGESWVVHGRTYNQTLTLLVRMLHPEAEIIEASPSN
jgi:hypothetical protein